MTRAASNATVKTSSKLHDVSYMNVINIGKDVSVRGMYYSIV